jgi:hypothetical protein
MINRKMRTAADEAAEVVWGEGRVRESFNDPLDGAIGTLESVAFRLKV